MQNLHIIFTRHNGVGNCNSNELLRIIEHIKPEIIFEELETTIYDLIYTEKKLTTLETDAIKEYLTKHDIPNVPVDTLTRPLNFHKDCEKMRKKIAGMASKDSFDYRNLIDRQISLVGKYGFDFLNSDFNDKLLQEIDFLKEKILNTINDNNLHRTSALEREINEKREDEILNNVYGYCRNDNFTQALLFIGSGHRESILEKMKERNPLEDIKLNYILHSSKIE